jgi:large subunit ribosomal protein L10
MDTSNYSAKVNPRNKVFADKIRAHAKNYSIVGVIDVSGLPAPQFQRIRATLKKSAEILIVKKNLIEIVLSELESSHKGVSQLFDKCSGVVGLVFTNDNPFTLFKFIKKNKSAAPAKAGQVAPNDIVVPAGPTSFAPGPIIGELGALKIKAGINAGKVEIKEDSLVAKEGDVISAELAGVLSRLGIEPMEVGLNLKAICEDSIIYGKDVLDVDEEAIISDLKSEALRSFKLSIGLEYYTKENITHFITEGARDSLGLGVGIAYPAAETIKRLVSKANAQMGGVAMALPEELRPAGVAVAAAPVAAATSESAEANEGKKEEKAAPVADAAAGLGNLF